MITFCLLAAGVALGLAVLIILVGDRERRVPPESRRVEYIRRRLERRQPLPLRREADTPKDNP